MERGQLLLFEDDQESIRPLTLDEFRSEIESFNEFGKNTDILEFPDSEFEIPVYINEFWTSKQRAALSLHEISYRACFKPQLPQFFINRLTECGDSVYDPFMGRGTTVIEAALLGRKPLGCDINPLSRNLTLPRFDPPDLSEIRERLASINLEQPKDVWEELLVFYHPNTLLSLTNLREYLLERETHSKIDRVDAWIRMVATNRLTGHSRGFFSVYTLPPNQAVSIGSQLKINENRQQTPEERDVLDVICRKSRSLLRKLQDYEKEIIRSMGKCSVLLTGSSDHTPRIEDDTVKLVVTSPPFLDTVNYQSDNWLRCWFNGIEATEVNIWQLKNPMAWQAKMTAVFCELKRVLIPGGYVAFEVGEVRGGKVLLETIVAPAASKAGLKPLMVLVNDQVFTKTSNCWGIDNLKKGTNTNRIVLLRKED